MIINSKQRNNDDLYFFKTNNEQSQAEKPVQTKDLLIKKNKSCQTTMSLSFGEGLG